MKKGPGFPDPCFLSRTGRRSVVAAGQERRQADILAAFVLRFRTLGARATIATAARAAIAALAAGTTITAAFATRTTVTIAATATATVTTTVATVAAAAITAIAARATIAAFAGLARRAGVFQLFAGFLIDDAHRQANLAARIDLEDLDLDFLAFAQGIRDLLDALVLDLRDVDETVLAAHEVHERTEIDEVDDLAVIDLADFGFFDEALDPLDRGFDLRRDRSTKP
jgi:hypothetical protein